MPTTFRRENGDTFQFDVEVRFDVSPEVIITDHPIEDGSVANDHAQRRPLVVSIVGITSDTPFSSARFQPGSVNRSVRAGDFFTSIEGERVLLIHPKYGVFPDMMLLRHPFSHGSVRAAERSVAFKQVKIPNRESVQFLSPLSATVDLGKQPTTNPADADEAANASALFKLGKVVGVF